jgi:SAM-dependent methyltransferase
MTTTELRSNPPGIGLEGGKQASPAGGNSRVHYTQEDKRQYVQFGCGLCAPVDWLNFDAGPAFWMQKNLPFLKPMFAKRGYPDYPRNIVFADVVKGLPLAPDSVKAIYCSHVLEHLSLDDFRTAIRNVYRYLKPGGTFRLVVPDLEYLARTYIADPDPTANSRFMSDGCLGRKRALPGLAGLGRKLFGRTGHLWMWDFKGMARELAEAGFINIRRAQIGDSSDPHFVDVEDPGRWENCLGVESNKP